MRHVTGPEFEKHSGQYYAPVFKTPISLELTIMWSIHGNPWPLRLPNLNSIEHLQDIIDWPVRAHNSAPETLLQLWTAIEAGRLSLQETANDVLSPCHVEPRLFTRQKEVRHDIKWYPMILCHPSVRLQKDIIEKVW